MGDSTSNPRATFATPLPQSPRSSILEWRFPKPHHQYVLTGRSRAAWQTSFIIPQLNLLLDAGLCVNKLRPKHIFLTHGHSDHTLLSPAFVKREDPPDIYCPAEMKRVFDDYVLANTMLNLGGLIQLKDAQEAGLMATDEAESGSERSAQGEDHANNDDGCETDGDIEDDGRSPGERAWLNTHRTHGMKPDTVIPLPRLKGISATTFACDHTVPCLGYLFTSTTHRLRSEFSSLSGTELRDLRQSGADITAPHTVPVFAFLGDTTAATLDGDPLGMLSDGVAVVITECSFLLEEHRTQAEKTKHTLWSDLEKVVRRWPKTTFVLMHFSLRYGDGEVATFFRGLNDCPDNIVIWVDEHGE